LFQRANDMLQFGSPKIQTKIREIYDKSNSRRQLSYGRAAHKISSPVKSEESVIKSTSRAHIVHPDVKFKTLPFFSKLETIVRPTALVSSGVSGHSSMSMKVKFHLTPQQIHQIYISKTSTGTYQTQILVRFCLQETTCDQNDYYPKQCYVKVNGHSCPIPGYHPHLSTRPEYKRNGQPVNITNFVKTSPTEMNEVTVFWAPDFMLPQGYCVGIEISKVVSSSDLLQGLKAKGVRSSDMSRALVKEKFTVDKDSEVAATSMKVSLLCPIGKMRMSYPCRTTSCTHLQCFDASIFYQMNEK
jgi:E3 SUMO-protein ligase PIAS1